MAWRPCTTLVGSYALRRAMAEDIEALRSGRGGPGFVRAERPSDLARALGRDRRAQAPRRAFSAS
ncbi:hypothetical protein F1D61_30190 [Methylobacterium aquaticum]|uniref:Uncharacterized protein n=1 Tax=Methylobacterium aquaticum TaxID=270351 RepID=A0A0C6FSW5_9HYPH|nr:hypothetical protein F1D61_30190 [Methylobacterium aquaticum]BAQ45975.1 hypothetical protein Maq22A_c13890 [Methylobacterium aquaticum]